MLQDLSREAGEFAAATGRHIHLVLENGDNCASLLDATEEPPRGKFRAQWNDDYHHAWHVLLTGESQGYYGDYQTSPRGDLARSLASGFVYQGENAPFWGNNPRGEPSGHLAPTTFVNFVQNHDQIGNRALGDRLEAIADPKATEAALAVTLLAPMPPMLFMGEEWGSKKPFPFFCDFKGDLAEAVRRGRRAEYDWAYRAYGDEVPDPLDAATFRSAVLDWDARTTPNGRARLELVQRLLAMRRGEIAPRLRGAAFGDAQAAENGVLTANWRMGDGTILRLLANLSPHAATRPRATVPGTPIWGGEVGETLAPWSVFWRIES
jgi:maltooligosyltrehalose trehalohydrolase